MEDLYDKVQDLEEKIDILESTLNSMLQVLKWSDSLDNETKDLLDNLLISI